ncbi:MAG TPA: Trm112 family protein, partial [Thermoanaerobaculia bacterium]|nr:Trm112 family protein [Thermoanaerobaculia bacterium]
MIPYVCPNCRGSLADVPEGLSCAACGLVYPVADGIADFASGVYYDNFSGQDGQELAAGHLEGL